jgi:hypothetical protein
MGSLWLKAHGRAREGALCFDQGDFRDPSLVPAMLYRTPAGGFATRATGEADGIFPYAFSENCSGRNVKGARDET